MQVGEYQFLVICIDRLSWEHCELRSWERVGGQPRCLGGNARPGQYPHFLGKAAFQTAVRGVSGEDVARVKVIKKLMAKCALRYRIDLKGQAAVLTSVSPSENLEDGCLANCLLWSDRDLARRPPCCYGGHISNAHTLRSPGRNSQGRSKKKSR